MSDQSEVHRTLTDLEKAKAVEITTQAVVNRAQAVEQKVCAQIETVSSAYDSIVAQERDAIPSNDAAIRHLSTERSFLESKRRALEGALTRAQSEHAKARTDLDTARAALARADLAHRAAVEHHQEAQALAEEARLVAALDPGALARKDKRERAEAILAEHTRIVRSHGVFSPGGGPCEASIEAEKARTISLSNKEAFAPGEHGWGVSSFERGRYSSPVGARCSAEPARPDAPKPYNTHDPLSNE